MGRGSQSGSQGLARLSIPNQYLEAPDTEFQLMSTVVLLLRQVCLTTGAAGAAHSSGVGVGRLVGVGVGSEGLIVKLAGLLLILSAIESMLTIWMPELL